MMKKSDFLHIDTNSLKLKVSEKKIEMGVVINECDHSGCRNLKLTVSHKEINGINLFLLF